MRVHLPREFLERKVRKERSDGGQQCRQGNKNVAAVTVNRRSGRVAISRIGCELLGSPQAVTVIQDADHPRDWYIRPSRNGYVLKTYPQKKTTSAAFFDKRLTENILKSQMVSDVSIRMGIAPEPDTEGRYALLYYGGSER